MLTALAEARLGGRAVRPNPMVGAALLSEKGELATGFHKKFGGPHAEIEVLKECKKRGISTENSIMAVTLEPCSHKGKTGPCVDALIAAKVKTVFVGCRDPFEGAQGRGIAQLVAAGISVFEGFLTRECEALNQEWLSSHRLKRPFVRLKMATSLDGLWSSESGESKWITGVHAREAGLELRSQVDALITGARTVEVDNPQFTARSLLALHPYQPKVFVLSRNRALNLVGTKLEKHPAGAVALKVEDLSQFLCDLHLQGLHSVMVEAGPTLSAAFLELALVDELWLYMAPKLLGGEGQRLKTPFNSGRLPGLPWHKLETREFPEGDVFFRLGPKSSKSE